MCDCNRISYSSIAALILSYVTIPLTAQAQVIPDGSLSTAVNSVDGVNFTIVNGDRFGNNLFHSFNQFSVPSNGAVTFNNDIDITNILGRVTGGNVSTIDGLIQANGAANLFLINPDGIQFGPNARLNIGGSFIASTADRLVFDDGRLFSATNALESPVLTISGPIGLQFGDRPGAIQVQGQGHQLSAGHPVLAPINQDVPNLGLQVRPGYTLALIGGTLNIAGGEIVAPSGRLELGSITSGEILLQSVSSGWNFSYDRVDSFGDIDLSQRSLLNAGGSLGRGAIHIAGRNIQFTGGSLSWIQNRGSQAAGAIQIEAQESLLISGLLPEINIASGLFNETVGPGAGGNIIVTTGQLTLADQGDIVVRTFSSGSSGDIVVEAAESIEVIGIAVPSNIKTSLSALTFGTGDAGQVTLSTKKNTITRGGIVSGSTFNSGNGGDVTINATDSVEVSGFTSGPNRDTGLLVSSSFNQGNAANLAINTGQLRLLDGGIISSSAYASGSAGNIRINATERIEVRGGIPDSGFNSAVQTVSEVFPGPVLPANLGLPGVPTGDSGGVVINAPRLEVADGAEIAVSNQETGNAGDLRIQASSVFLDQGIISASTSSGEGGSISLGVSENLQLRRGSLISAKAVGTGNGGNIEIGAGFVIAIPSENSDIIANAEAGDGGNIQITTQGLFGLAFQEQLTPESDIVASSQFGVDGVVQINEPEVDPSQGIVELPSTPTDPSTQIATGCATVADNSLVITGRGNLPEAPNTLKGRPVWDDLRSLEVDDSLSSRQVDLLPEASLASSEHFLTALDLSSTPLIEATGVLVHKNGRVELTVATTAPTINRMTFYGSTCMESSNL